MRLRNVRPKKLHDLIKDFLLRRPNLSEKFYAEGRCWETTEEFIGEVSVAAAADDLKWDVRAIKADKLPEYKKYFDSHWIAWINGYHIDFTARQFHHAFAFPRIWRGSHGCKLKQMRPSQKNKIGIPTHMSAWEYLPK